MLSENLYSELIWPNHRPNNLQLKSIHFLTKDSFSQALRELEIQMKSIEVHAIKFPSNVFNYARHNLISETEILDAKELDV